MVLIFFFFLNFEPLFKDLFDEQRLNTPVDEFES